MYIRNDRSPCEGCTRLPNPEGCENKNCKLWKAWFLRRWGAIYGYGRQCGLHEKGGVQHAVEE